MKCYRGLLFLSGLYFLAVAAAHQLGLKIPMLYVFYAVVSERYQDLIISFLSFGWAMLFIIGFLDTELKARTQIPVLISGIAAICGLIRARLEVRSHHEIDLEIAALAILLLALITTYFLSKPSGPRGGTTKHENTAS